MPGDASSKRWQHKSPTALGTAAEGDAESVPIGTKSSSVKN